MLVDSLAAGLTAAVLAGISYGRLGQMRSWSPVDRLGALLVPVLLFAVWLYLVRTVALGAAFDWNDARLAPLAAWVRGYKLYYPEDSGPILSTVYGPVSWLVYLPATVCTTPTSSLLVALGINPVLLLGPLLYLHLAPGRRELSGLVPALLCFLASTLFLSLGSGTGYWLSHIGADVPALGLGLLSCAAVIAPRPTREPGWGTLAASATLAMLAAFAKLIALPLIAAVAFYLAITHGRRSTQRYILCAMVAGGGLFVVFGLAFGFGPMWFNMVTIPSRHPWKEPGIWGLLGEVGRLAVRCTPLLAFFAAGLWSQAGRGSMRDQRPGSQLAVNAWVLPILVAALSVPTSVLGANKVGGEDNSFHAIYYLLSGLSLMLAQRAQPAEGTKSRAARITCYAFAVCVLGVACWYGTIDPWQPDPDLAHSSTQEAFDYARRHPGEAYFPWQPLASLLAERRAYHFDYALYDRDIAGFPPSAEHVHAYLPPRMRFLAVRGSDMYAVGALLAEYSAAGQLVGLPGWSVFARLDVTSPTGFEFLYRVEGTSSRKREQSEGRDDSH